MTDRSALFQRDVDKCLKQDILCCSELASDVNAQMKVNKILEHLLLISFAFVSNCTHVTENSALFCVCVPTCGSLE